MLEDIAHITRARYVLGERASKERIGNYHLYSRAATVVTRPTPPPYLALLLELNRETPNFVLQRQNGRVPLRYQPDQRLRTLIMPRGDFSLAAQTGQIRRPPTRPGQFECERGEASVR